MDVADVDVGGDGEGTDGLGETRVPEPNIPTNTGETDKERTELYIYTQLPLSLPPLSSINRIHNYIYMYMYINKQQ